MVHLFERGPAQNIPLSSHACRGWIHGLSFIDLSSPPLQVGFKRSADGRVSLRAQDGRWFQAKNDMQAREPRGRGAKDASVVSGGGRHAGGEPRGGYAVFWVDLLLDIPHHQILRALIPH